MNVYFKPTSSSPWQPLGNVTHNSISGDVTSNHYESVPPQKIHVAFAFSGRMTQEQYNKLFKPYPRIPRKLKKEIKSFRRWLRMSYKKCSRLELIQTCCMIWDMAPGHEGVITPAWITRAGYKLERRC